MNVTSIPVNVRAMFRRWLVRQGHCDAARALDRNNVFGVLALVPAPDRRHARALADALLAERRRNRQLRAEERSLWQNDPVLREAHAFRLLCRRRRTWVREARLLLRQVYTNTALELLRQRGVRPTLESARATAREVQEAVRAASALRRLAGNFRCR